MRPGDKRRQEDHRGHPWGGPSHSPGLGGWRRAQEQRPPWWKALEESGQPAPRGPPHLGGRAGGPVQPLEHRPDSGLRVDSGAN